MENICVVGVGYVGLVTGTCFADLGNNVVAIDISEERIRKLREGIMPIYEPGLEEMVKRNVAAGRLRFTTSYEEALKDANFAFICVGTPSGVDGEADLQYVRDAAETIARTMDHPLVVINKSTVPVGTGDWVADIIRETQPRPIEFSVVSCPEFLREGAALSDFLSPDRTVLGSENPEAAQAVARLHLPLRAPIMITDLRTAEMIKYASNAFLATKISFINEIANICEDLGADVTEVARGMGFDKRIGAMFLSAGIGYGGSCFAADETIFELNSPNPVAVTLEDLFDRSGEAFQGDVVEVKLPEGKRVLGFDLETGRPALTEVKAVTRRPYQGTMVNIKTSMGRALRVTADHPVILNQDGGFEIVPALDVNPGDRVMTLMQLPAMEAAPAALNLIDLLKDTDLEADVYVTSDEPVFTEQYARFGPRIPKDMLRHPYEIKRHNRMALPIFRWLTEQHVLNIPAEKLQLYTAKGAATRINAVIPVDGDLLRLCGYYIAEGYISAETGRAGATRQRVGLTFHENEREYSEDARRILGRYGLKFIERNSTHATTTVVSSRVFAWLLRDVLRLGTNSSNKALPTLALNTSPEMRFELLRGMFSGDGAVTPVQEGRNLTLEYATTSKRLADGVVLLLQTLGVVPSLRRHMMNKPRHLAYTVRVSGYAQLEQLKDVFGEKHRTAIEGVLAGYQKQIKQRGFDRHGAYTTLTVQDVEYEEVDTTVYSLETTTGVVLTSSALISKNCFPKDVKALAHMAQVRGKHPQLLHAVMDINDYQRRIVVLKLRGLLGENLKGKTIGLLGLAFKPGTDDLREAPALTIAELLRDAGATVRGYDPVAMENVARYYPWIELYKNAYELAEGCDALVVVTEWNEFKQLDMDKIKSLLKQPVLVDGRNLYDPALLRGKGFAYRSIGRGFDGEGLKNKG